MRGFVVSTISAKYPRNKVPVPKIQGSKCLLANGQKTTVLIPVIVKPVKVEVALGTIPVEVRHVAITIGINLRRAVKIIRYRLCHRP